MHPRNRFRDGYDFAALVAVSPALATFVRPNPFGDPSIDYGDPDAVRSLNAALLAHAYGVTGWSLPPGYLCPPIPGRSDYLHYLADLLSAGSPAAVRRGPSVAVLDIGVGASCIFPIVGASEYGWRVVGVDTDRIAVDSARTIVANNPILAKGVEIRLQRSAAHCFSGVMAPGERFAASMCNPPFHRSADEAAAGTRRKLRNLRNHRSPDSSASDASRRSSAPQLNFGGQPGELWCDGGEVGFIERMIAESAAVSSRIKWFTTLVSNSEHVPALRAALRRVAPAEIRTIDMSQGQKRSRILAWSFTTRR